MGRRCSGESLPVTFHAGETAKMGSTVSRGEAEAVVTATGADTFFGKTATMIKSVDEMGHFQKILLRITFFLLCISVFLVSICMIYMIVKGETFLDVRLASLTVDCSPPTLSLAVVERSRPTPVQRHGAVLNRGRLHGGDANGAGAGVWSGAAGGIDSHCDAGGLHGHDGTGLVQAGGAEGHRLAPGVHRGARLHEHAVLRQDVRSLGLHRLCCFCVSAVRLQAYTPAALPLHAPLSLVLELGTECGGERAGMGADSGTMTLNKMELQDEMPTFVPDTNREEILRCACLAAKWKEPAKDALDTLVLNATSLEQLDVYEQLEYVPFDPSTKRTEATLKGPDGVTFRVVKGAPNVVLDMCANATEIRNDFESQVAAFADRGVRCLAVARSDAQGLMMMGVLTFLDPPRHDTKWTVERSYEYGVGVKMITGDHAAIAKETCRVLGMGTNILTTDSLPDVDTSGYIPPDVGERIGPLIEKADGFAQVFPEHKFLITEALRQRGYKVGMTGDGVNDAPAIKKADIGIAVDGATDAARAAADIVLTTPGLGVIVDAIVLSRCIFNRMKNYVVYRIACTFQLLVFFFCGVMFMHPNELAPGQDNMPSYFNLPVVALIIITILNDGTIISIAYDFVTPSKYPEKWHLNVLFVVSTWLGLVAVASSILLLYLGLKSHEEDSVLKSLGGGHMTYAQIQMMLYLKISLSDFLTVFAARTRSTFYSRKPGGLLATAAVFAMCVSTLLALHWPLQEMESINANIVAFTWVYCIAWFLLQDITKVALYKLLWDWDVEYARTEYEAQVERNTALLEGREHAKWEKLERRLTALEEENVKMKKMMAAAKTGKTCAWPACPGVG
jgi:magnesium-transporting ATPase (P-type)